MLTKEQKNLRDIHRTLNILGKIYLPINPNRDDFLNEKHWEGMKYLIKGMGILFDLDYDLNLKSKSG